MYETYQILQEKTISRFSGLLTEAEILLGLLRKPSTAAGLGIKTDFLESQHYSDFTKQI